LLINFITNLCTYKLTTQLTIKNYETTNLTQDETIAEITAKHQANAELEIEKFKLSFEVEDARNTLTGKFYSQHDLIDSELTKE
jgi:hypothetical protein